ncbi:MAG: hypothetical protein E6I29_02270 [Chloroflexi bacterium]|nr:MAG: hypothetical protein E6I29_02270 [Chloroflexota bacterium]
MIVPQVAEDGAVEVDKPEQPDGHPDGEDHRHGGKRSPVALRDRGFDGSRGVAHDVPQQEDEDAGGECVEKALDRLRQAVHSRHREPQEDGGSGDGSQADGGALVHSCPRVLVLIKDAISSV